MPFDQAQFDKERRRVQHMRDERTLWEPVWREIQSFLAPHAGRFSTTEHDTAKRKHGNIYDNSGLRSLNTLSAGLMSGATSPARPWFRLATSDNDLMRSDAVKFWLSNAARKMLDVFQRSNTYRSLHTIYEEIGAFGVNANIVTDHFDRVIHHTPLTIGEFSLATNYLGEVDVLTREFPKTVDELVREFGRENCSTRVQALYDRGDYTSWVNVTHIMAPRDVRDLTKKDALNMPYASKYFETDSNEGKYLREGGMKRFRATCPRWLVVGSDVYASSCPGMVALGDIKQLQHEQLRKANAIDFQTNPPLQVPTTYRNRDVERFPGGVMYVDAAGGQGVRSAFEVNLNLSYLLQDIQDVRQRVNQAFYTDVFMMIASGSQTTMKTATEIAERHEEKMLMLGPVLERLHNELLQPLVDITFERLLTEGAFGPPPPELEGQEIKIEFVSVLAQAQRAVNAAGIDRFAMSLGAIAGMKPGVLDKFNEDEWADVYSDMYGVPPELIVPDRQVAMIRKQRADQVAAQQQMAATAAMADTASKLGNTPTDGKNLMTDVMSNLTGYTTGG